MRRMTLVAAAVLALFGSNAFAQGGSTSSISGVVVDSGGGVVPGADVLVKNDGTGESFTAVTSEQGVFSVPSLNTGTYTVTITLQGFKTVVLNNVVLNAGVPASLRAKLEVGGLEEQVVVRSNAELVNTKTATVTTSLDTRQITNLPLSSRNAADFITFLTGVQTAGGSRDSIVNGLPQSTINMTLDGVNIQDNTNKTTDGFFAIVGPRLDAIEEVTFSSAAQGSEGTGMGATQIKFVTKSGTNDFHGGYFHTFRHDSMNTNNWFNVRDNLPKPDLLQNQPGFNIGGPILLPGFNGRNRAFFFVNYEELRQNNTIRRDRTILFPSSQNGVFRYNAAGGVREVNVFNVAAANGQTATPDPTIARLLTDIRSATTGEGNVRDLTDPLFQEYSFQVPVDSKNNYPTVRLDYQLSSNHRLSYSLNYQYFGGGPDTTNNRERMFPGFPVVSIQDSVRRQQSGWLRSVLSANLVNEFRVGYGGAPVLFSPDLSTSMWTGSLANQGGFHLNMNNAIGITNAGSNSTNSARDADHFSFENTLNWQKGSHTLNVGANYTNFEIWLDNQQLTPELRFDVVQDDPADAMFNTTNFPGASNTVLGEARDYYAVMTGRVSEVRGIARLDEATGQYEYLGLGTQRAMQREVGLWVQDSWRMNPNLSLNFGVRYELQMPFVAKNNSYSIGDIDDVYGVSGVGNLFMPGVLTGQAPQFHQLTEGEKPYPTDWNNIAPSVGVAWTPSASDGMLRRITGDTGDFVVRAGYTRSYTRMGLGSFTGQIGANPGVSLNVFRQQALGNLGTLPLLLRDPSRLGPADFPSTPVFPYTEVVTGDITIFSPDLRVPSADTWQAGITRALGRTMSLEARYVGARSNGNWRTNNYNELNIIENGFLGEFRLAQQNLQAHVAAGCGQTGNPACSFAYRGPGTGTSPLPTFFGYFQGAGNANSAAAYTSANFRSNTFLTPLARFNPNPYAAIDALDADANSTARAIAAGLAPNLILANPDLLGGANIVENDTNTMFNSMVLELRRRVSSGLAFQTSYAFGHATQSQFLSLRIDSPMIRNVGAEGDVTHAFKANVVYELPFGQGRRFGSNAGSVMNQIIGGWQLAGNARVQSGQLVDMGNVRLVGMTEKELEGLFKLRKDAQNRVWMLPQDIIDESVKAFSASATSPTGYGTLGVPSGRYIAPADSFDCIETIRGEGACGTQSLILTGPMFKQFDFSVVKRFELIGRTNAEFRFDVLNAFNNANFVPVSGMTQVPANSNRMDGSDPDEYEVTDLTGTNTARVIQLVARFRF